MHTFLIRSFEAGEWAAWRTLRLAALADAPYAFSASLADAQARPDATWAALLAKTVASPVDLPLLAECDGQPAGLAWAQDNEGIVNAYQVWVAPAYRGRGIAQALMERGIGWARERRASAVELGVTKLDTPAFRLYQRLGFEAWGAAVPMANRPAFEEQPMRLRLDGGSG
ncbi:ribosomal protein S18 acetylase RimI-like enzyme [Pseudoduganella lurida]|uniref:Ribosomal protein S18 acetylase RimI-like enzyme n=1 Tax=Pseudoduganella lurida TaxID=1036180 RepID=A0A562RJC7_9BURK|nr:GNAT family N-acetyltransferase [Pseudoduganella lurida]TWI69177.1 ribosomal protein S18 acetylase RimI-like enzyme [Pseudoduganella lurida]